MPAARTIILGDSHIIALEAALRTAPDRIGDVFISRLVKPRQDGRLVEGVAEADALAMVAALSPGDRVVSAIGGNQFNTFGMMRHAEPFDMIDPDDRDAPLESGARVLPLTMIDEAFDRFVRGRDGGTLTRLVAASAVRVFHLEVPPPKGDNQFIERNAETYFQSAGIERIGVSSPALRVKLWRTQARALRRLCDEIGAAFVPSPAAAAQADGCLRRDYYGRDATHANAAYGALVLDQIAALTPEPVR